MSKASTDYQSAHSEEARVGGPVVDYKADVAPGTDLVKWHCNRDQVFVVFASIPDNYKSPATNVCCKTKKSMVLHGMLRQ